MPSCGCSRRRRGALSGDRNGQGSILSPLLANVYLHHVLDVWFENEVRPRLQGPAVLIRYCDDFVIGCARQEDAERVMSWLGERFRHFGLELHPEKTRLMDHRRPRRDYRSKGPSTFDFLRLPRAHALLASYP